MDVLEPDPHVDNLQGLSVACHNVRGLGDNEKKVRCKVALGKVSIMLLQETHSIPENEYEFKKFLGRPNMCFSHGETNSRGMAIALDNSWSDLDIEGSDTDGRLVACVAQRGGQSAGLFPHTPPTT